MAKISDQVRQAIERSGLSRYRIAKELGVSQSTLSRFMAGGSIRTQVLDRIGDLLGLRIMRKVPTLPRARTRSTGHRKRRRSSKRD